MVVSVEESKAKNVCRTAPVQLRQQRAAAAVSSRARSKSHSNSSGPLWGGLWAAGSGGHHRSVAPCQYFIQYHTMRALVRARSHFVPRPECSASTADQQGPRLCLCQSIPLAGNFLTLTHGLLTFRTPLTLHFGHAANGSDRACQTIEISFDCFNCLRCVQ